jgi:hypothetical protein
LFEFMHIDTTTLIALRCTQLQKLKT